MLDTLWEFTQFPAIPQTPSLRTGETTGVRVRDRGEEVGLGFRGRVRVIHLADGMLFSARVLLKLQ